MGWIANVFAILGLIYLGRKKRIGFLFGLACNIIYAIVGYKNGILSLTLLNVVLAVINIWYWVKRVINKES